MGYVVYNRLSLPLRREARKLHPHWRLAEFGQYAFWVTDAGHISLRPGHHLPASEVLPSVPDYAPLE